MAHYQAPRHSRFLVRHDLFNHASRARVWIEDATRRHIAELDVCVLGYEQAIEIAEMMVAGPRLLGGCRLLNSVDSETGGMDEIAAATSPGGKSPDAVSMGRRGGRRGGPARAAKLTPEQRTEIARNAANARWSQKTRESSTPPE